MDIDVTTIKNPPNIKPPKLTTHKKDNEIKSFEHLDHFMPKKWIKNYFKPTKKSVIQN